MKPKLTTKERGALVAVRDMLASGEIVHKRNADSLPGSMREHFVIGLKRIFNMGCTAEATECGSVGCIGGWMGAMMGMTIDEAADFVADAQAGDDNYWNENKGNKFSDLFFPPAKINYERITEKQAVRAINSFLKTGKPNWAKACAAH